jgi:hypothetical protein
MLLERRDDARQENRRPSLRQNVFFGFSAGRFWAAAWRAPAWREDAVRGLRSFAAFRTFGAGRRSAAVAVGAVFRSGTTDA